MLGGGCRPCVRLALLVIVTNFASVRLILVTHLVVIGSFFYVMRFFPKIQNPVSTTMQASPTSFVASSILPTCDHRL